MDNKFLLVYACLIWILAVVLLVSDFATFRKAKEIKNKYDLSNYTVFDYSKSSILLYGILVLISTLTFIIGHQSLEMAIINGAILIMSGSELITAKCNYKLYMNDKDIIYENELYRIKNLKPSIKIKKFGRNYEFATFDGKTFHTNKKVAEKIDTLIEARKEEKQARKKK